MLIGVAFALVAGMMWGLVFVGPLMLPEYPAMLLSFGRYLAFGLIALPLAWLDLTELRRLSKADWIEATKLCAIGNLLYYICLASAIQRAGAPLPTMIIGTLPVVIAICANVVNHQRDGQLPWAKLFPSIVIMVVGLVCVNHVEVSALATHTNGEYGDYFLGILLALGALACWTWYPIRNANWLRDHPGRNPRAWATAQGLITLPLALVGYIAFWGWTLLVDYRFDMPFGPRAGEFIALMLVIGLLASWLGTLCWNEASQRLPTALVGQLIVFEMLAALTYAYLLRQEWPEPLTWLGITLLLVGVLWAVRIKPVRSTALVQ